MPDDLLVNLCDQGQGKRPGCTQLTHDELLGVVGMRCVLEGLYRHLLDGLGVGGEFCSDLHGLEWVHKNSASTMPQTEKEPGKRPMALLQPLSRRSGMKKPPEGGSSRQGLTGDYTPATSMPLNSPVAIFSFQMAGPVMWALVPPASTATVTGMSTTSNS